MNTNASLILRANPGMIRDCFVVAGNGLDKIDPEGPILAVRQVKFNEDGSNGETKIIRLTRVEVEELMKFWKGRSEG